MIYEYKCEACLIEIEVHQKMSDPPLERCPDCGGSVKRILSLSGIPCGMKQGSYASDTGPRRYK
jgi:putative FmdB family regulatory protein